MIRAVVVLAALAAAPAATVRLDVPLIHQAPERCGPAALGMVLRYYRADSAALAAAERAYDPALKGTLITDLAGAARRAGFDAAVETPGEDSLRALLARGVPPVLLYDVGFGPISKLHYAALVGWDVERRRFVLHDGGPRPRTMGRGELLRRWGAAGGQALVVRRP